MRKTQAAFLLLVFVGIAAYSNTFQAPFQFDDGMQIVENPVIRSLHNFFSSWEGYSFNPRRFVGYATFALNFHFGGLDVTGYHLANLLIHISNGILVYYLVLLTFRTPYFNEERRAESREIYPLALFSALLFVAHPVQTQAVTYIVQRLTSLATMFYLLAVVTYIKGRLSQAEVEIQPEKKEGRQSSFSSSACTFAWFFLSLLLAVLAMKTKEISFTLPLIVVLYEFSFFGAPLRKKLLFLLPVVLTLAVIPLSVMGTHRPLGEILSDLSEKTKVQTNIPRWDYLVTQFRVIMTYVRLIFLPVNQNLDYDYPVYHSLLEPPVLLSALFLAAIFGTGVYMFYKSRQMAKGEGQMVTDKDSMSGNSDLLPLAFSPLPYYRLISFGIFWFFITLSVESSVIPIADVIFEHRLYLPSVGAFVALATGVFVIVERLGGRWMYVRKGAVAVMSLVIITLAGAAYTRNGVWGDETRLWEDVVRKSPDKSRPHNDLAFVYLGRGRFDEAVEQSMLALRLDPRNADAYNNLGVAYFNKGWLDASLKQFRAALGLSYSGAQLADSHHNLGIVYTRKGMLAEALTEMKAALRYSPRNPEIYSDMGVVYKGLGEGDKAVECYRAAIALEPDYAPAFFNLGLIYEERGLLHDARDLLGRAHKLDPQRF